MMVFLLWIKVHDISQSKYLPKIIAMSMGLLDQTYFCLYGLFLSNLSCFYWGLTSLTTGRISHSRPVAHSCLWQTAIGNIGNRTKSLNLVQFPRDQFLMMNQIKDVAVSVTPVCMSQKMHVACTAKARWCPPGVLLIPCCLGMGLTNQIYTTQWVYAATDPGLFIRLTNSPPVHFLPGLEQAENISHLDQSHWLTLDRAPRGFDSWTYSHAGDLAGLCLSRVELDVSKSPERGRRGSFTHRYCHDNCCKDRVCDWCSSASFCLASCHVKEFQAFLHSVYSCEECSAECDTCKVYSAVMLSAEWWCSFLFLLSNLPAPCLFPALLCITQ